MLAEKVVKFENESSKIHDQIQKWLNNHGYNSDRTRRDYEFDVKLFFKLMKQKEITYLTKEDVQLTLDDFEDFIDKLYKMENEKGERNYSNKTINRKVAAVKGMIKYLAGKKLNGEYIVKDIAYMGLINSLPENSKSHGILESNEVWTMANLSLEETHKGNIKRLAILFTYDTCARKSDVLNLKWSDFEVKEDVVVVNGIGKGNKEFRKSISKDFYEEILTLKEDGVYQVFQLTDKNIDDMMRRLREKMNIDPNRGIVYHSIRKTGSVFVYRICGNDIMKAKEILNHSNVNTTQLYLKSTEYTQAIGGVSSAKNINHNAYKEVDHETLLKAIEGLNKDQILLLNLKISELLRKNIENI
jgi:integrase